MVASSITNTTSGPAAMRCIVGAGAAALGLALIAVASAAPPAGAAPTWVSPAVSLTQGGN